jgi:hypothetical protein
MINSPSDLAKAMAHIEHLLLETPVVTVPKEEFANDFGLHPGFETGFLELRDPPFRKRFEFLNHGATLEFRRILAEPVEPSGRA